MARVLCSYASVYPAVVCGRLFLLVKTDGQDKVTIEENVPD